MKLPTNPSASTAKWTTLDPRKDLCGSDWNYVLTLKLWKISLKYFREHIGLQTQAIYVGKNKI